MSNDNNTLRPSLDDFPTEIVAEIGRFARIEGLPALRLTGRLAKNATLLHFAKICFQSLNISVSLESFHKLYLAASHPKYGPQIHHIEFNISGIEDIIPPLLASSWATIRALAARYQKVRIQVNVNALAVRDSTAIETSIHLFLSHITRANSFKPFLEEAHILDLPSPAKSPRTAPRSTLLFHNLAINSITKDIHISYSDMSPIARIEYSAASKTLLVQGLEVKHLPELRSFFKGIHLEKLIPLRTQQSGISGQREITYQLLGKRVLFLSLASRA